MIRTLKAPRWRLPVVAHAMASCAARMQTACRQPTVCLAVLLSQHSVVGAGASLCRSRPTSAAAAGWWQQRRHLTMAGQQVVHAKAAAADDAKQLIGELRDEEDLLDDDLEGLEEDVPAEISTSGTEWGEKGLVMVQELLGSNVSPELADIHLFSFRAIPSIKRLEIRLEKTTDPFGSPTLDDIAAFSRLFNAAYEAALGKEAAGEIEVEVSSPGAERQVRVPGELQHFAELPMRVEYVKGDQVPTTKVLRFVELDAAAGITRWRLADVRANRAGGKGRPLGKNKDAILDIALAGIRRVNLHVDF